MLPSTHLSFRDTVRLVSTARSKPPVLSKLAISHEDLEALAELESATNERLIAQRRGLDDLEPSELVYGIPNHTFVNAAFIYTRAEGNRFNDQKRGAWYAALERETAIQEVSYHLARELENIGHFENQTSYAELLADFTGNFHDLRSAVAETPCLAEDIEVGYPAGQELARLLRAQEGIIGVVYRSVRRDGGQCLASFYPSAVQNIRQGAVVSLEWTGERTPVVTIA